MPSYRGRVVKLINQKHRLEGNAIPEGWNAVSKTKYRSAKRYVKPIRQFDCVHRRLASDLDAAPAAANSWLFRSLPVIVYGHAGQWV